MQVDIADEFFLAFLSAMQKSREVSYMLLGGLAINSFAILYLAVHFGQDMAISGMHSLMKTVILLYKVNLM